MKLFTKNSSISEDLLLCVKLIILKHAAGWNNSYDIVRHKTNSLRVKRKTLHFPGYYGSFSYSNKIGNISLIMHGIQEPPTWEYFIITEIHAKFTAKKMSLLVNKSAKIAPKLINCASHQLFMVHPLCCLVVCVS